MKRFFILICSVAFMFGCVTKLFVTSETEGAKIYVDGQLKGETPCEFEVSAYAWYDPAVVLKQEGYRDLRTSFKKEVRVGNTVAGALFVGAPIIGWPCLFTCYGPAKNQYFEMKKAE